MSGNVWMFSNEIDDEDLEFMSHDYVTYNMACEYYRLGIKPVVRMAHEAGAVYKVGNSALINTDIFEMYLEKFKEPTRPLPKHIWNKLSSEDKKDHNSTCFDKKDP